MKQHHRPQYLEIYPRQYYNKRVHDKVQAEIKDKGFTQKEVLTTIKHLTAEAFKAESTELKEPIYAKVAAMKSTQKSDQRQSEEAHTPESYAVYIQD